MQHGDAMTRKGMGLGKFEPGGSVSLPRHVLPIRFREACAARQCLRGRSNDGRSVGQHKFQSLEWKRKKSELEGQAPNPGKGGRCSPSIGHLWSGSRFAPLR